jgi:hypothetical protein
MRLRPHFFCLTGVPLKIKTYQPDKVRDKKIAAPQLGQYVS